MLEEEALDVMAFLPPQMLLRMGQGYPHEACESHVVSLDAEGDFSSLNAFSQAAGITYDEKHEVTCVAVIFALNLDVV